MRLERLLGVRCRFSLDKFILNFWMYGDRGVIRFVRIVFDKIYSFNFMVDGVV